MKKQINNTLQGFILVASLLLVSALQAQPLKLYVEGVHYTALDTSQRGTANNEVMEVFWYGCSHCYAFEPLLESWKNDNPDFSVIRSPITWDSTAAHHAKLYFTAEALGITEDMHSEIFDEIHQHKNYLLNQESAKAFFISQGVNTDDFDNAYNSFGVSTNLRRADAMQRDAGISSVPSMIVSGKYLVKVNNEVRDHQQVLNVVEYLLALESS